MNTTMIERMIEESLNEEIIELTDEVLDVLPLATDPMEGIAPCSEIRETPTNKLFRLSCNDCDFHGTVNQVQVLKGLDIDHMNCPRCNKHTVRITE